MPLRVGNATQPAEDAADIRFLASSLHLRSSTEILQVVLQFFPEERLSARPTGRNQIAALRISRIAGRVSLGKQKCGPTIRDMPYAIRVRKSSRHATIPEIRKPVRVRLLLEELFE